MNIYKVIVNSTDNDNWNWRAKWLGRARTAKEAIEKCLRLQGFDEASLGGGVLSPDRADEHLRVVAQLLGPAWMIGAHVPGHQRFDRLHDGDS